MAISGVVSIPSAAGSSTAFTVYGSRTLGLAQQFQAVLGAAIQASNLDLVQGQSEPNGLTNFDSPASSGVNEAVFSADQKDGVGIGDSATIPAGYQFLFDNVNGPSTVDGPVAGIRGIFEGTNSAATFVDEGGNNVIVFADGDNLFQGDMFAANGFDTVAGGTGFDTIDTGHGDAVVYSGTGNDDISLNDVTAGVASNTNFNDYVYLADGESTVHADGRLDAILASSPNQVIYGGDSARDYTGVVLLPAGSASGASGDVVYANAATVAAFDENSGNTITGGSGRLLFIGGANVSATLASGSGQNYAFGATGDTLTWTTPVQSNANVFVGGIGGETLDAAGATGPFEIFGYNDATAFADAQVTDLFSGGSGNDTLLSGSGRETLDGGGGANQFIIDRTADGQGAQITLGDFGTSSSNSIGFSDYTVTEIDTALAGAHSVMGALGNVETTFTLSDNTTVTVIGVASLAGKTFGG